ncbi:HPr(Ser) kinase/phosphatase [Candidatus Epulonipiscioides saccharophilum]|nr:HPr(Ser) kinase/phosphatase [Epulopiscium sp. SCG-B10WGA-EpuloB]
MLTENKVSLSKLVAFQKLEPLTNVSIANKYIETPDVNRPAVQFAGFFEFFDSKRVQVIGVVEHAYLRRLEEENREIMIKRLDKFFSHSELPCIILSAAIDTTEIINSDLIILAKKYDIPVFKADRSASLIISETIRWLNVELGPTTSMHGVLVDIYGEGVLIIGDSGVGKSETALELIRRGHRLVADDAVEIKRVSGTTIIGTAPEILRHFIEVRGIGIVNIKELFGIEAVKQTKEISLVIQLENWDKDKQYDRLGLENEYTEILGLKVITHRIPIRPGRNLAIICETAAVNFRQKLMGYNAAEELNKRVMKNLQKNMRENRI